MNLRSLACVLLLAATACQREPAPAAAPPAARAPAASPVAPAPAPDRERPSLDLPTLDGGHYSLAERRGRWVVVNFWATWCAPCRKEMPELSQMHQAGRVQVVGLAYEDTPAQELRAFLAQHPVAYPVAQIDVAAPPRDFDTPRALPTTYLIDPDGRVAHVFLGPVTAHDIEARIGTAGRAKATP